VTQATSAPAGPGAPLMASNVAADTVAASAVTGSRRTVGTITRALFLLTKPRIIELLLVTTLPTMFLARRGLPGIGLIAVTLVGGALAAASALKE